MDTKSFLARFEVEKHILAMLDHPNVIAMTEFVEADMAKQLAHSPAMEATGEFAAVPSLPKPVN